MRASPGTRLRVAVVGGGIGTQHIDALIRLPEQFELVAFCDIDPAKVEAVVDRYGIGSGTTSYDALLARDDVDIVDLCTPASLHVAQTEAALEAGKHVICEKPLAGSLAEVLMHALAPVRSVDARTATRVNPIETE